MSSSARRRHLASRLEIPRERRTGEGALRASSLVPARSAVARGKMAGRVLLSLALLLLLLPGHSSGAKKAKQAADSDVIEDVNGKQLEGLLQTEEYLAVFFCEWQQQRRVCVRVYSVTTPDKPWWWQGTTPN